MKRFFTLSFLFFSFVLLGQNLIPDPSAEDYVECPTGLGILETWNPNWQSFRGTPDYFNNCSNGLGSENPLGFQEPRTGEGYLGLLTFERNLINTREYIGVELLQPLAIGSTYHMSFHVSRAHQDNGFNLATNNLGALLMTANFLESEEQGPTPNFSSFNEMGIVEDTLNWVEMSYQFIADSAYQYLAFGNFFEDALTDTLRIGGVPTGSVTSYYYFDDFCLTQNPNGCDFINSTEISVEPTLKIWPNPCLDYIMMESDSPIFKFSVYNVQGKELLSEHVFDQVVKINLNLESGIYLAIIESEKGIAKKRFMVTN